VITVNGSFLPSKFYTLSSRDTLILPEFTQLKRGVEIAKIQLVFIHENEQWEWKKTLLPCIQNWNINTH